MIGVLYLFAYFYDPYIVVAFKPLQSRSVRGVQEVFAALFIIDMLITPFTGIKKEDPLAEESDDDDAGIYVKAAKAKKASGKVRGETRRGTAS